MDNERLKKIYSDLLAQYPTMQSHIDRLTAETRRTASMALLSDRDGELAIANAHFLASETSRRALQEQVNLSRGKNQQVEVLANELANSQTALQSLQVVFAEAVLERDRLAGQKETHAAEIAELKERLADTGQTDVGKVSLLKERLADAEQMLEQVLSASMIQEETAVLTAQQALRITELEEEILRVAQLEEQASRVAELEEQASRIPGLEQKVSRVPELEQHASRIPELEQQASRIPQLEEQVLRIPELEMQVDRIPELVEEASSHAKLSERAAHLEGLLAGNPELEEQLTQLPSLREQASLVSQLEDQLKTAEQSISTLEPDKADLLRRIVAANFTTAAKPAAPSLESDSGHLHFFIAGLRQTNGRLKAEIKGLSTKLESCACSDNQPLPSRSSSRCSSVFTSRDGTLSSRRQQSEGSGSRAGLEGRAFADVKAENKFLIGQLRVARM